MNVYTHCDIGVGLGIDLSGGALLGYWIQLGGVYGGSFNETTGTSGVIGTAATNLPGTIAYSIKAGGDADISINSSSGAVSSARAIFDGDSAAFIVRADNGTNAIEFPFTAVGVVAGYRADALALFARMTTQPDATRKGLINQCFADMEASGQLAELDALYVFAAHDAQAAGLNWIADQYNITPVNSPTFVADRYYQGNGTNQYLDTGFNAATASSPKWTLNNAMLGIWSATDLTSSTAYDAGVLSGTSTLLLGRSSTGPGLRGALNGSAASFSTANSLGHLMLYRTISAGFHGSKDGTYVAYAVGASSAVASSNMCFMRGNTNYSSRKLLVGYIGKPAGTHSAFDTAIRTYLTAIGAI